MITKNWCEAGRSVEKVLKNWVWFGFWGAVFGVEFGSFSFVLVRFCSFFVRFLFVLGLFFLCFFGSFSL